MLQKIILVALGGGIGAVFRYLVGTSEWMRLGNGFPLGTLTVNLLGCLLIGLAVGASLQFGDWWIPLIVIGLLGGFTTFSSFGLESFKLLSEAKYLLLTSYILISNIVGIFLVFIGIKLTNGV